MAGSEAVVPVRQLFTLDEYEDVVMLQKAIWGFAEVELLPVRFLVVIAKIGGHVFGAYDGAKMVGFCFALPGIKAGGRPYLHSHMLGVLPGYHNAGIGRRLKLMQRDEALARGIQLIEWTFDPLELKNAFFNIERLGAIVRSYSENQYGLTASPLHGGLPTDRCIAEWWLDSYRVRKAIAGERTERRETARVAFPADIAEIRANQRDSARNIQAANARRFQEAFARGLAVTGFVRGEKECVYLLEPWQ